MGFNFASVQTNINDIHFDSDVCLINLIKKFNKAHENYFFLDHDQGKIVWNINTNKAAQAQEIFNNLCDFIIKYQSLFDICEKKIITNFFHIYNNIFLDRFIIMQNDKYIIDYNKLLYICKFMHNNVENSLGLCVCNFYWGNIQNNLSLPDFLNLWDDADYVKWVNFIQELKDIQKSSILTFHISHLLCILIHNSMMKYYCPDFPSIDATSILSTSNLDNWDNDLILAKIQSSKN